MAERELGKNDAIVLVDVQRDFFQDGPLAVPGAEEIIPVLNDWIRAARDSGATLIATRDWHTVDHVSFQSQGGPWPPHCVQDTPGAFFHNALRLPHDLVIVSKGTAFDVDNHSAFDGTGLEHFLHQRGITRLWIGGLTEDVSVRRTVEDACRLGFETHLIVDATRPFEPSAEAAVLDALKQRGAHLERARSH